MGVGVAFVGDTAVRLGDALASRLASLVGTTGMARFVAAETGHQRLAVAARNDARSAVALAGGTAVVGDAGGIERAAVFSDQEGRCTVGGTVAEAGAARWGFAAIEGAAGGERSGDTL